MRAGFYCISDSAFYERLCLPFYSEYLFHIAHMRRKVDIFYQMRVRAHVEARASFSADVPHSAAELRVAVDIADIELPCDLVLFCKSHDITQLVVGYCPARKRFVLKSADIAGGQRMSYTVGLAAYYERGDILKRVPSIAAGSPFFRLLPKIKVIVIAGIEPVIDSTSEDIALKGLAYAVA